MEILTRVESQALEIADSSHASSARLAAQRLALALDFDEVRVGRVALLATEAVTNIVKHAGRGWLQIRPIDEGGVLGIEMLAIDRGPGMRDFRESSRDGVSSVGTPGTGLGAIQRQSDEFEVYTHPGAGTILRIVKRASPAAMPRPAYEVGAILVPKAGETACGDAWTMATHPDGATFLVVDGLGHGPDAARASAVAVETLHRAPEHSAVRILDAAHGRMRATRGAALAVMRHERTSGEIAFAGVGNIAAVIVESGTRRAMVSHNGIVGHNVHKSQEFRYPWPRGALLIAHSDGLATQWDLAAFPGIASHHPSIVAAALFGAHTRHRDDVVVLVARRID